VGSVQDMVVSVVEDARYLSKMPGHRPVSDDIGLRADTSSGMHEASVKRVESHHRVLEALEKAGTKPEVIR
jgi:hypothetical protein